MTKKYNSQHKKTDAKLQITFQRKYTIKFIEIKIGSKVFSCFFCNVMEKIYSVNIVTLQNKH